MLTPTGATVTEYWNAIKAGNPTHVKMEFTAQGVTITDADIDIRYGVVVNDILNGETDLTFGQAVMKTINTRVILNDNVRYLNWADKFSLFFGVEINGSTNWVKVGEFYGERPMNASTVEVIEYTAYDRMKDFEVLADDFLDTLTYPVTTQQIYEGLCTYVGITVATGDPLANAYARSFEEGDLELHGYTCRDILAWIAEACGCYAKITADGKCKLTWFSNQTSYQIAPTEEFHIEHADLYSGMIWNEFDQLKWNEADMLTWDDVCGYYTLNYGIRAVRLVQTSLDDISLAYPQAEEKNIYTITDNPFLFISDTSTDITTYVKPIYDRLELLGGQLPMTTECVGNWLVEAGDIIGVYVADEIISSSIYVRTLVWKGNVVDTYETTGNKDREVMSQAYKERMITSRSVRLSVKDEFYQIQSGIEIAAEGITIDGSQFVNIVASNTSYLKMSVSGIEAKGAEIKLEDATDTNHVYIASDGIEIKGSRISIIDSTTNEVSDMWGRDDIVVMNPNETDPTKLWRKTVEDIEAHMSGKHDWVMIRPYYNAQISFSIAGQNKNVTSDNHFDLIKASEESFGDAASGYSYDLAVRVKRTQTGTQPSIYFRIYAQKDSSQRKILLGDGNFSATGGVTAYSGSSPNYDMQMLRTASGIVKEGDVGSSPGDWIFKTTLSAGAGAAHNLAGDGYAIHVDIGGTIYGSGYAYIQNVEIVANCNAATSHVPCTVYYYP